MVRAYSLLTIKAVEPEARIIRGLATSPETDRMGDVVEPAGAKFRLPLPLLLHHDHAQPIGVVRHATVGKDGIRVVCKIGYAGISSRIDEAWQMIRDGLIQGLSIGFRALESKPASRGGRRFTEWEWIELSAVTVPANAACGIAEIKALANAPAPATARANMQAGDVMQIPNFPRSLSKADRGVLAQGTADQWAEAVMGKGIKAGLKFSDMEQLLFKSLATVMVHQRWAAERIEALEGRAND